MSSKDGKLLYTTWFGVFIIEGGEVCDKILFDKDPDIIAEKRFKINKGDILDEEEKLAGKYGFIKVTENRLSGIGEIVSTDVSFIKPEDYSYSSEILQESLTKLGSLELRESVDQGEHLAKAVKTIQDLNDTINQLMERLRDWYSIYYPELQETVDDDEFLKLIKDHGSRETIQEKTGMVEESVGGSISKTEEEMYRRFAGIISDKRKFREELWSYVEELMRERAPTLTELTGVKLGAELVAQAGSLENMAKMPSSTIQVLGAEKALFSHLSKGTKPPKHGLILQHPYVHKTDPELRGKVSRVFANKIAIAARIDYFGNRNKGTELRDELEKKIKDIRS
ncbi:MAG: NOP5/NOP56 family protein [Candidatus Saliniplasma sp.]